MSKLKLYHIGTLQAAIEYNSCLKEAKKLAKLRKVNVYEVMIGENTNLDNPEVKLKFIC